MVRTQSVLSDDQMGIFDCEAAGTKRVLACGAHPACRRPVYGSGMGSEVAIARIPAVAGSVSDRD